MASDLSIYCAYITRSGINLIISTCMIIIALTTLDDRYVSINADHIIMMEMLATGTELRLRDSLTLTVKETVIEITMLVQDSAGISNYSKH